MCETCERIAEALHSAEREEAGHVEEVTDAAVRIAEIEAKRDVDLAKINRGLEEKAITAETDAALVEAETKADVLETVVETMAPEPEPAPAAPVVVAQDVAPEPEAEQVPPEAEKPEHHETKKSKGLGLW